MKKGLIVVSLIAAAQLAFGADDLKAELEALKKELQELKSTIKKSNLEGINKELSAIKKAASGNNLKLDADYRVASDWISYEFTDGSKAGNSALLTNRLIIGTKYAPMENLSFIGKLSYHKAFGDSANHSQSNSPFGVGYANFDWVTNENALDNTLKVKEAYFLYEGDIANQVRYTASIGRRPSTNGLPVNLRDDDEPQSPLGHGINVEFDGASFRFDLDKVTGIDGMYFKLCLGRGLTNAKPRFDFGGADYAKNRELNSNVDLYGFIFVPYDNGQFKLLTSMYWAQGLIGFDQASLMRYGMVSGMMRNPMTGDPMYIDPSKPFDPANGVMTPITDMGLLPSYQMAYAPQFKNLGDYMGGAITGMIDGFTDFGYFSKAKAFISWAFSETSPKDGNMMLGSGDKKFGDSWYAGVQLPCLLKENAKWGFEWNKGSKYWRSMTFGEDTMIGSKLAARGSAYEAYFITPLVGKYLTGELRYTYIDYDYTGSNSFFGQEGAPIDIDDKNALRAAGMNPVEKATDVRFSIRYKY